MCFIWTILLVATCFVTRHQTTTMTTYFTTHRNVTKSLTLYEILHLETNKSSRNVTFNIYDTKCRLSFVNVKLVCFVFHIFTSTLRTRYKTLYIARGQREPLQFMLRWDPTKTTTSSRREYFLVLRAVCLFRSMTVLELGAVWESLAHTGFTSSIVRGFVREWGLRWDTM